MRPWLGYLLAATLMFGVPIGGAIAVKAAAQAMRAAPPQCKNPANDIDRDACAEL